MSHNNISGGTPEFVGKLPYLKKLYILFNELEGKVPNEEIFANTNAVSILGNHEVCRGPPNNNFLHAKDASSKKHTSSRTKVAIIITVTFLFFLLCSFAACCIVIRNSRKRDLSVRSSRGSQSENFDDDKPTLSNDPFWQQIKLTKIYLRQPVNFLRIIWLVQKVWFNIQRTV